MIPYSPDHGIPYAEIEVKFYAICPVCDEHVQLRSMKDHESFTQSEYAEHYAKEHDDQRLR